MDRERALRSELVNGPEIVEATKEMNFLSLSYTRPADDPRDFDFFHRGSAVLGAFATVIRCKKKKNNTPKQSSWINMEFKCVNVAVRSAPEKPVLSSGPLRSAAVKQTSGPNATLFAGHGPLREFSPK